MAAWQISSTRRAAERRKSRKSSNLTPRALRLEPFEERILFDIGLVAIIPSAGSILSNAQVLNSAPTELTFRFDSNVDAATLDQNPTLSGIQLRRAGADTAFGTQDDVYVVPSYIAVGEKPNEVIVRFAQTASSRPFIYPDGTTIPDNVPLLDPTLPNGVYQIHIVGAGAQALKDTSGQAFNGGVDFNQTFNLELGPQILSIVPQPITRTGSVLTQAVNQIDVYFNANDPLNVGSAQTTTFYQLIRTTDGNDQAVYQFFINPISVNYSAATGKAVLTFAANVLTTAGIYRLRIGNSDPLPLPTIDLGTGTPGSSIATAYYPGAQFPLLQGAQSVSINGTILPIPVTTLYPGGNNEPGTRTISPQLHVGNTPGTGDLAPIKYNFKQNVGTVLGAPATNSIRTSPEQLRRVREVLSYYSYYLGVEFVETEDEGWTIATSDIRVVNPDVLPNAVRGLAGNNLVVMSNSFEWGDNEAGGDFFVTAMHGIGTLLGLGDTYELPALAVQGTGVALQDTTSGEGVFPGDSDILLGQYLHPPVGNDIDVYRFALPRAGQLNLETFAQRLTGLSSTEFQLDSVITVFDSSGKLIARNDDYYGNDSFLQLQLNTGTYYVVVTSTGNTNFDPTIENTGFGGTTHGRYELKLTFTPTAPSGIRDTANTLLDGDGDGAPGGANNFWFRVAPNENLDADPEPEVIHTLIVDKAATGTSGLLGSLTNPYRTIAAALGDTEAGDIVRIVGNGGADGNLATIADNLSYNVGFDNLGNALSDGSKFEVPRGVTVMIDAGAIIKLRGANIDVGSSAQGIDRDSGALQVLGVPTGQLNNATDASLRDDVGAVYFTSYYTTGIGTDSGTAKDAAPVAGNWGGLVFRNDPNLTPDGPDLEAAGIFLNSVNNANLSYGGGKVIVNSVEQSFAAIHLVTSRPSVSFNTISRSADAAVSADPNSFQESDFQGIRLEGAFTTDYTRRGPKVYGNTLSDNSINGLFVRIRTDDGRVLDPLTVSARFSTTDMTYVINENLEIAGNPGGALIDGDTGLQISRLAARLAIDPGVIVKLGGARIETQIGSQFIAEGTAARPITFTSVFDDSFGSGGSFDATNDNRLGAPTPAAEGNWGGLFFGPLSIASLDSALVTYAGGNTTIEGGFATFNALEIHQADARIANTTFRRNAGGGGDDRNGRSPSTRSVIFVRGAQPVLIGNVIENNDESAQGDPNAQSTAAISINVNSLNYKPVTDMGRSVGFANIQSPSLTNTGPLIRGNRLANNPVNGLVVRGGEITTNVIWDDTDIVHVLFDQVRARNQFSLNGTVRLQSTATESLVVKLFGPTAGFTAGGTPLDINDRIGGTVQVVGTPNHPVILTSLFDDTVGAGFTPGGAAQNDTDNQGDARAAAPGDWRSIKLDTLSNDTNVDLINEIEQKFSPGGDTNNLATTAQFIGSLAKDSKSGDDVQRLGFEIHGSISQTVANNKGGDADVYSFRGTAGSSVWFDIDRTSSSLDTVVELIDALGGVFARSDNSWTETVTPAPGGNNAKPLQVGFAGTAGPYASPDFYSTNPLDAGMRLELPLLGTTAGTVNTYFVRVRAKNVDLLNDPNGDAGGLTKGTYQLQIRLQDADVVPGSVVRNADIRFATNGVEIIGKPERSPLMGDTAETSNVHDTFDTAQNLGNLLASDTNAISVAGNLGIGDVDWYKFDLNYDLIQAIGGYSDFGNLFPTMFQINYADGLSRPDTTLSVFDQNGSLIYIGRDSDNPDSLPRSSMGTDTANLSHGSFGTLDPTIGSAQIPAGSPVVPGSPTGQRFTYYVAVSAANRLPTILDATFRATATNPLVRLQPVNSVTRVVDDSIGSTTAPAGQQAFPGTTPNQLNTAAVPYSLADVVGYVGTIDQLYTINPFTGQVTTLVTESNGRRANERLPDFGDTGIGDLAMRPDGRLMSMASGDTPGKNGTYFQIDTGDGSQVTAAEGGMFGVNVINANDVIEETLINPPTGNQPRTYAYEAPESDFGINVNGMTFGGTLFGLPGSSLLYVVGNRTAGNGTIFDTQNLLFRLDPNTGAPFDFDVEANDNFNSGNPVYQPFPGDTSGPNPLGPRSGTPVIPRGVLNTGATILTKSGAQLSDGARFTIRLQDSVALGPNPTDGRNYFIDTRTFEFNSSGGIAASSDFAVPFNPGDSAEAIANSIAIAITNAALKTHIVEQNNTPPTRSITAIANGNRVTINNSRIVNASGLTGWTDAEGAFDGASIEAIAFLPGGGFAEDRMYAASSGGGIYEVTNYEFDYGAQLNLLGLYTDDFGNPAVFTGLSAGPPRVENGRYAQTLFATSAATRVAFNNPVGQFSPEIWTFNNVGQPSPMLLDGATKVKIFQTDVSPGVPAVTTFFTSVQGITFSSLDYNPWHATTTQGSDPLGAAAGNTSYYFGLEQANTVNIDNPNALPSAYWQPGAQEYVPQGIGGRDWTGNPSLYSSYNLPGGALGSLLTKEMDLSSYSASDKPTLYFNYSLDTDNVNDVDKLGNGMTDSFRVFASSDGANWTLLGTNNSIRSTAASSPTNPNAELPPELSVNGGQYKNDRVNQQVQELFDLPGIAPPEGAPVGAATQVQQWRQARIDLGDFAGKSGVQIRFDFSTAGSMGIGDIKQGGVYLAGVAASKLQNNQQFTIDSSTFTFRSGFVLQAPAGGGKVIQEGETFTVNGITTFQFTRNLAAVLPPNLPILINDSMSAEDVAQAIADAIADHPTLVVTPVRVGDRVQLVGATTVTQTAPVGSPAIIRSGAAQPAVLARTDVPYTIDMTDDEVAIEIATALDREFSFLAGNVDDPSNFTSSKVFGRTIRLYGHNVTNAGPLPYSNKLEGDQYSTFYSPLVYDAGSSSFIFRNVDAAQRSVNNARQGVFIDDLIIGFAGRGEQVINGNLPGSPTGVTTLDVIPSDPAGVGGTQVTVGNYQLSIRRGTEYAQGAAIGNSSAFQPGQTFDINDRLAQGITLYAIPASQIVDGSTFSIVVAAGVFTFEFSRDAAIASGINRYRVAINTGDDATAVAIAIRNAINGVPTSTNFGVKAGLNNGTPVAGQARARAAINLFGAADANPGPLTKTTFGVETEGFPVLGDASPVRLQGQTIVENSRISNTLETGVTVKPVLGGVDINGVPIVGTPGDTGSMVNLPVLNTAGLVPGITIKDNLIVAGGANGILFTGSPNNDISHAVPFGRIINNTIVKTETGIRVTNNASPTILNNILALNETGIFVDASSATTVVGANIYQKNLANLLGVAQTNAIFLQPNAPLFVNSDEENYYLAANSLAIDSSVNTLQERPSLQVVTAALGIPPSLIQAPDIDLFGQLRIDDPAVPSPPGLGSNVFKDRGALERSDFAGPTASLRNPVDNDAFKADSNATTTKVTVVGKMLTEFVIQLNDTGLGVDASTIVAESFAVQRKVGNVITNLVAGVDFTVALDTTNMIARIIPVQGVWSYATYTITLANGAAALAIKDKVGNSLQPNQAGQNAPTEFVIQSSLTAISPWQNPINQFDVNGSGSISGIDALLIINRLLNGLAGPINPANPATLPPPPPAGFYIDVNGDGSLSPTDALLVINYLMTNPPAPLVAPMASFEVTASPNSALESSAEPAVGATVASASSVSPDTSAVAAGLAISQMVSSADESAESSADWVAESTTGSTSQSQAASSSASAAIAASFESESFDDAYSDLDSILDELAEESLQLAS
jgi:hypothetical protein